MFLLEIISIYSYFKLTMANIFNARFEKKANIDDLAILYYCMKGAKATRLHWVYSKHTLSDVCGPGHLNRC